jgi:hypothetical protein
LYAQAVWALLKLLDGVVLAWIHRQRVQHPRLVFRVATRSWYEDSQCTI